MIVTIDGPAGSGKSTAARKLADLLGVAYLDTGAMYRAVTLKALREGIDLHDQQALYRCAASADIRLTARAEGVRVELDGQDVSDAIRSAEVTDKARYAAGCPGVREAMVRLQRQAGAELGSFVTEGRDQGSAVFPDAEVKIFLHADPLVRAQRRAAEMAERGEPASVEEIHRKIVDRDESDRNRQVGPLVQPADAVAFDTGSRSIEQTAQALLEIVRDRT